MLNNPYCEYLSFCFLLFIDFLNHVKDSALSELFQLKQNCLELCSRLSVKTTLPLEMIDKKENDREILLSPNLQHSNN